MLRSNLDELLLGDHDEVPESLSGKPSVLPSPASIGGNHTSLVDKAGPPTGAPELVPDTKRMSWQPIAKRRTARSCRTCSGTLAPQASGAVSITRSPYCSRLSLAC